MYALHLLVQGFEGFKAFQLLFLGVNRRQLFVQLIQSLLLLRQFRVDLQELMQAFQLSLHFRAHLFEMCDFGLAESAPFMQLLQVGIVEKVLGQTDMRELLA